ncbi:hypothetical protein ACFC4S_33170 [Priestia megaterium]
MNPDVLRKAKEGKLRDRGMIKWEPFRSITEQWTALHTFTDIS